MFHRPLDGLDIIIYAGPLTQLYSQLPPIYHWYIIGGLARQLCKDLGIGGSSKDKKGKNKNKTKKKNKIGIE